MSKFLRIDKLLVLFFFLGTSHAFSQYNIDSLKTSLKNPKQHDTTKLATIALLIGNLYEVKDMKPYNDLMGKIAFKNYAKKNSDKLHKIYTTYLAGYYNNLAYASEETESKKALYYIDKSIALYESIDEDVGVYTSMVSKGKILSEMGKNKEAIACYFKSLRFFERNPKGNFDGIISVYSNLGSTYGELNQYKESIYYMKKAIHYIDTYVEKLTVEYALLKFTMYYNIGSDYIDIKNLNEAVKHLESALRIAEESNYEPYIIRALGKLAFIDIENQKLDEAEQKLLKVNSMVNKEDLASKSFTSFYLGKVYFNKKYYGKAKQFIEEALALSKLIKDQDLEEKSYDLLYRISKETGDYKTSVAMLELFHRIKDAAKIEEAQNELKQEQLKYDYERKEFKYKLDTEKKNASKNILLLILLSAVILLLIGAYFLYRNYKHKQAISIFEKNELNQKLLLKQMNPHFIFNSIDNIQSLIYNKQEKEAVNYLTKFSKLTRQILENSNESYVSLSEELAMIDNYLVIQQLLYNNKFNFSIVVDEAIDPESIVVPPMLTQPFIENAIKHGLKNKTDNGLITIRFYWQEKQLIFEVSDNGIGFNNDEKSTGNKSLAMKITKERLANIAKKSDFEIHTQNLFDDDKHIVGAKVYFDIPYLYEN